MSILIECRQLTFCYPDSRPGENRAPVLRDVDAVFPGGRITLVSGASGAGKSTLLHLLAGMLRPTSGEIRAGGQPVSRWLAGHRDLWRRHVGIMFQQDYLVRELTALENVMLPLIPRSGSLRQWRSRGREMLLGLNAGDLCGRTADALSGGQRQRVSAARALVAVPDYIVADEPAAHQDRENARCLGRHLRQAADRGAAVIVAAHDRHVEDWLAVDRHLLLETGKLRPVS